MTFIKNHWFGLLLSLVVGFFMLVFALVLFSPREDLHSRGFIPCTEEMAYNMLGCNENKAWCMLKEVVKNTFCDIGVIVDGVAAWHKGEQPRPWSNYFFTPELPVDEQMEDELVQEYYENNPDLAGEMNRLKKLNKELENGTE